MCHGSKTRPHSEYIRFVLHFSLFPFLLSLFFIFATAAKSISILSIISKPPIFSTFSFFYFHFFFPSPSFLFFALSICSSFILAMAVKSIDISTTSNSAFFDFPFFCFLLCLHSLFSFFPFFLCFLLRFMSRQQNPSACRVHPPAPRFTCFLLFYCFFDFPAFSFFHFSPFSPILFFLPAFTNLPSI